MGVRSSELFATPTHLFAALLQAGRLAQRRVDAVLPAGTFRLKVVEHVAVDAQGDRLPGARQRRLARDRFRRLGGGGLEGGLGGGARVVGSARSIGVHGLLLSSFTAL